MDCSLPLPEEIKTLLSAGFYSEKTKSSALDDFLNQEKHQFYEHLYDYRVLDGTIVDDSLTVDRVELEEANSSRNGTVSLSFYEEARRGCDDLDKTVNNSVDISFDLTTNDIILHFIDNGHSGEPEP